MVLGLNSVYAVSEDSKDEDIKDIVVSEKDKLETFLISNTDLLNQITANGVTYGRTPTVNWISVKFTKKVGGNPEFPGCDVDIKAHAQVNTAGLTESLVFDVDRDVDMPCDMVRRNIKTIFSDGR